MREQQRASEGQALQASSHPALPPTHGTCDFLLSCQASLGSLPGETGFRGGFLSLSDLGIKGPVPATGTSQCCCSGLLPEDRATSPGPASRGCSRPQHLSGQLLPPKESGIVGTVGVETPMHWRPRHSTPVFLRNTVARRPTLVRLVLPGVWCLSSPCRPLPGPALPSQGASGLQAMGSWLH